MKSNDYFLLSEMPYNLKPQSWQAATREVMKISKGSPIPIDAAIRDVVIGLRAFRLPTVSSCVGHLGIWGAPYPWVEFQIPRKRRPYAEVRKDALHHQEILQWLLGRFYKEHQPKYYEDTLSIHFFKNNNWSVFTLQSVGAQFLENCPSSVQTRTVLHLRFEMRAFGKFLKAQLH